jgi:hypothetical protein
MLRRGQAQHLAVDGHGGAGGHVRGQPVDVAMALPVGIFTSSMPLPASSASACTQ